MVELQGVAHSRQNRRAMGLTSLPILQLCGAGPQLPHQASLGCQCGLFQGYLGAAKGLPDQPDLNLLISVFPLFFQMFSEILTYFHYRATLPLPGMIRNSGPYFD